MSETKKSIFDMEIKNERDVRNYMMMLYEDLENIREVDSVRNFYIKRKVDFKDYCESYKNTEFNNKFNYNSLEEYLKKAEEIYGDDLHIPVELINAKIYECIMIINSSVNFRQYVKLNIILTLTTISKAMNESRILDFSCIANASHRLVDLLTPVLLENGKLTLSFRDAIEQKALFVGDNITLNNIIYIRNCMVDYEEWFKSEVPLKHLLNTDDKDQSILVMNLPFKGKAIYTGLSEDDIHDDCFELSFTINSSEGFKLITKSITFKHFDVMNKTIAEIAEFIYEQAKELFNTHIE